MAPEAVWIMNRLRWGGYMAYLVGGSIRDLLLNQTPKDFDLTTDASPNDLSKLFYNCRIIGRRFRIVHIYFRDGTIFEVSTFRALSSSNSGRHSPQREDNRFGSPQEDAWRRDITINGLFYDSATRQIIDYVGGLADLKEKTIRTIGPPRQRFREDPVRMIRAIRHAVRNQFHIEPKTWEAIRLHASDIKLCSTPRVLEEFLKELRGGHSADSFALMQSSKLLHGWLPGLSHWLNQRATLPHPPEARFGPYVTNEWGQTKAFWKRMACSDAHIKAGHGLSDLVLIGSMCLPLGWSYVIKNYRPGQGTRQLWHRAVQQEITSALKQLRLSSYHWQELTQLMQTYWRLHLVPQQPGLMDSLRRSEYLPEAVQLFALELESETIPIPDWLADLHPDFPLVGKTSDPTSR